MGCLKLPYSLEKHTVNLQVWKSKNKQKSACNWYDYGARFYDPALGRFNHIDPLSHLAYSKTPYHYCSNNPINRTDPTGLSDGCACTGPCTGACKGEESSGDTGGDSEITYFADGKVSTKEESDSYTEKVNNPDENNENVDADKKNENEDKKTEEPQLEENTFGVPKEEWDNFSPETKNTYKTLYTETPKQQQAKQDYQQTMAGLEQKWERQDNCVEMIKNTGEFAAGVGIGVVSFVFKTMDLTTPVYIPQMGENDPRHKIPNEN